jgi:hypothetical protein
MEKKNWVRTFIPPCIKNGEVDLEGHVKIRCPSVPEVLAFGDIETKEDQEKPDMSVEAKSKRSFEWAKQFVVEVSIKDSDGNEATNMDDLNDCNLFLRPLSEIMRAIGTGDYGKKSLTKTT